MLREHGVIGQAPRTNMVVIAHAGRAMQPSLYNGVML